MSGPQAHGAGMHGAIDWAGQQTTSLTGLAISGACLFFSIWIAAKIADRFKNWWSGAIAGLCSFALLVILTTPAHDALREGFCRHSGSYQACLAYDGTDGAN